MQETGRAGHDGHITHAILYEGHAGKSSDKRKDIDVYGCSCCDVCAFINSFLEYLLINVSDQKYCVAFCTL